MEEIQVGQVKKTFLHKVKLVGLTNSTIISCKAKIVNLFSEVLDDNKVIVFGDYEMFICYCNNSIKEENNFKLKTKRELFCEIIEYEKISEVEHIKQELEAIALIPNELKCKHRSEGSNFSNKSIEISIIGEINISVILKSNDKKNDINPIAKNTLENLENNQHDNRIKVMQFDDDDTVSLDELMEMDFKSLKHFKK